MKEADRSERMYCLFQKLGGQYPTRGTMFLPESEQIEELKKIFEVFLENKKVHDAIETAKLLVEPYRTEAFLKLINECRWLYDALKLINLLSEPQRTTRLTEMFERYHRDGSLDAAMDVAEFLGEPKRTDELARVAEEYIKRGQLEKARKVADMILKNNGE